MKLYVKADSPVLHSTEGLLVGDVVHEDEAHGAAVVSRGDGSVALLACSVLHKDNTISNSCWTAKLSDTDSTLHRSTFLPTIR